MVGRELSAERMALFRRRKGREVTEHGRPNGAAAGESSRYCEEGFKRMGTIEPRDWGASWFSTPATAPK